MKIGLLHDIIYLYLGGRHENKNKTHSTVL